MEEGIKVAWSTRRDEEFDMREFAFNVLSIARENLETDGELLPTAFIVTEDSIQCMHIDFADDDEKERVYRTVIDLAKSQNAVALLTVNDAYMKNDFDQDQADSYYAGKLAAEDANKCIMVMVSGPGIKNWFLDLPYERIENGFEFAQIEEESGGEIGLLNGWASDHAKTH